MLMYDLIMNNCCTLLHWRSESLIYVKPEMQQLRNSLKYTQPMSKLLAFFRNLNKTLNLSMEMSSIKSVNSLMALTINIQ